MRAVLEILGELKREAKLLQHEGVQYWPKVSEHQAQVIKDLQQELLNALRSEP